MGKLLTLCIVHEENRILLGMKKRGFGAGRWNGFGGKLNENESIEDAAKREMKEESGLDIENFEKVAIIEFKNYGIEIPFEVHIFNVSTYSGIPVESEEMKPEWFDIDKIPYDKMWPDDTYWLPFFIAGKKFKGKFVFGENDVVLEKELIEVDEI